MAEFTKELFLRALDDWRRYPEAFQGVSQQEQTAFLKKQGYATVRDLLTHVAAWWEEGRGIITDTIRNGDKGARKYDLDAFNAAALKRFQDMPDAAFTAWYESELRRMTTLVSNLTVEQLAIRRVGNWLDAVVLEHLKEHGFDAPRFLVVDVLQREWGDYCARFAGLTPEEQVEFLKKQGFLRFRDVLAHILAWWDQGIGVIQAGSGGDPGDVGDVDVFNAEAVTRFGDLQESQVLSQFDEMRLTLASLVDMLPDEVMLRPNVQTWLRAEVLDHYYDHAI